jgi:hypothetical protein
MSLLPVLTAVAAIIYRFDIDAAPRPPAAERVSTISVLAIQTALDTDIKSSLMFSTTVLAEVWQAVL